MVNSIHRRFLFATLHHLTTDQKKIFVHRANTAAWGDQDIAMDRRIVCSSLFETSDFAVPVGQEKVAVVGLYGRATGSEE